MRVLVLTPPGTPEDAKAVIDAVVKASGHERLDPPPPPRHAMLTQEQRAWFVATMDKLHEADIMVADVSSGNASVAWAVAWLLARGRLVVLTCPRAGPAREKLSPMIAGNPSPWSRIVEYDSPEALHAALTGVLSG